MVPTYTEVLETAVLLLIGHALCDFPLQPDFMAKAKNHRAPLPGIPAGLMLLWHGLIHAGAVALVLGNPWIATGELAAHMVIDYGKCEGWWGFGIDQALHVITKILWLQVWILLRGL